MDMTAQRDENRKWDEKFARGRQPQPVAHPGVILSQSQRQQPHDSGEQSGLPEMICNGDTIPDSFRFILPGEFQERFLRLSYVFKRERAGFHQMRHDGPAPAAEQTQQIVNQPAFRGLARHRRLENVSAC